MTSWWTKQAFQVRVAVGLAGAVVSIVAPERSELFEPLIDVRNQSVFGVVDPYSGGNMHGGDQDHALANAALFQDRLHL